MSEIPPATLPATGTPPSSWSIAQVERETGLGKDTLRAWERRYGFPIPERDTLGERAYPQEQLNRLRLIRRLLDVGHRPGKVVPLESEKLEALLAQQNAAAPVRKQLDKPEAALLDNESQWVQWLAEDRTTQIKHTIQQHILRNGLGTVVDQLVGPLCGLVGRAWMRGDISVYQEHLFTHTLQSVLREAIASVDAVGPSMHQRPRILLTTTPNEFHGLGLLMVECHLALESCERFTLGTCTPVLDIVQAVAQLQTDVLALSFSAYATRKDVVDNLRQLREHIPPSVEIWVGGTGAQVHARYLPDGLVRMRRASDVSAQIKAWRESHM